MTPESVRPPEPGQVTDSAALTRLQKTVAWIFTLLVCAAFCGLVALIVWGLL